DHVHPDAAAGDGAHLRSGAEAGRKDELVDRFPAQAAGLVRTDQPALDGLAENFFGVEPPSVVGDLDVNVVLLMIGVQAYFPPGALPLLAALLRGLDAVIDRVAQEVDQGIANLFDHRAVEICFVPRNLNVYLYYLLLGTIPLVT